MLSLLGIGCADAGCLDERYKACFANLERSHGGYQALHGCTVSLEVKSVLMLCVCQGLVVINALLQSSRYILKAGLAIMMSSYCCCVFSA